MKEAALSPVSTSVGLSLADISQSVAALEQILLEESVLLLRSAYVLDELEVEIRLEFLDVVFLGVKMDEIMVKRCKCWYSDDTNTLYICIPHV